MTPGTDNKQFSDLARTGGLEISPEHAAESEVFRALLEAAYARVRDIDTSDFEPAAIFVPTPSERVAE